MPDFLESAKNGSVGALEVLMNKSFGPKGVTVRVDKAGSMLKITLKTPSGGGPDRKLASLVKTGLSKISPRGFDKALVVAKTMTSDKTIWSREWELISSENVAQSGSALQSMQPSKNEKSAKSFKLDVNLEGYRKKVTFALLSIIAAMGFGWWWVIDSNTPKTLKTSSSAPTAPQSSTPKELATPKKIAVTPEEIRAFRELATIVDQNQTVITQIQQYSDTELLYLTVGQGFIRDNKVNQGDLAISLRDAWNKTCDCYGQLVFQSPGGQQLIHISALGQSKFKKR